LSNLSNHVAQEQTHLYLPDSPLFLARLLLGALLPSEHLQGQEWEQDEVLQLEALDHEAQLVHEAVLLLNEHNELPQEERLDEQTLETLERDQLDHVALPVALVARHHVEVFAHLRILTEVVVQ